MQILSQLEVITAQSSILGDSNGAVKKVKLLENLIAAVFAYVCYEFIEQLQIFWVIRLYHPEMIFSKQCLLPFFFFSFLV